MDKWTKLIPRTIFTALDGSPICAFLDMEDSNAAKSVTEMFEARGGSIKHGSPSPFTIFLTDRALRNSRYTAKYPEYPLFNVKWVFDCIGSVELVDINPYLINKDLFEGRNFMGVIYEKLETSEGTLLVENLCESFEDEWMMKDRKKPPAKHTRRRGPPKKNDHVLLEIDRLSQEDDFYCELTTSVVTKAIDNILLNERTLISKTEEELKNNGPEVQNIIFKHKQNKKDTSIQLLSDECESSKKSHSGEDGLPQSQPNFSMVGELEDCTEQENEGITTNQNSSKHLKRSDARLIGPLNSINSTEGLKQQPKMFKSHETNPKLSKKAYQFIRQGNM